MILHVDMDSFYASVEASRNPALKGRPVIVGADPKGGRGRGVVASCSYKARSYGIHSAMPISQAYRACPEAVYLRPNSPLYERVSGEVMRVLKGFADKFEQLSIDEAFLDISEKVLEYGELKLLALKIKEELYRRSGLTCSIGIAPNKSVAKIASGLDRPNGLTVVEQYQVKGFLDPLPVTKISGVGLKTSEALRKLGIETIGQLARYPREGLEGRFGKGGTWLWHIANGIDEEEVREALAVKSIGAESTFEEDVEDFKLVLEATDLLAEDVYRRLAMEGYFFKTVGIKIRFEDFQTFTRSKSLAEHTNSKESIISISRSLLKGFEGYGKKVRLVGARVSGLVKVKGQQKKLMALT